MPKIKEKIWEYDCKITFNNQSIIKFTITDHYLKKHSKVITNQLICELIDKLDNEDLDPEPKDEESMRNVYVWERVFHQGKKYRLVLKMELIIICGLGIVIQITRLIQLMIKTKKEFYFTKYGYTKKDFQRWGRKGGLVFKYASGVERQKAYRRRKMQKKIEDGLVSGVLNMETGRVRKWRNNGQRQRGWREMRNKSLPKKL